MAHSSAGRGQQAGHDHDPEHPVVEDGVDEHEDEPADPGQQAGLERRLPQGGRHGLLGEHVQLGGQRAVVELQGEGLGRGLGEAAADLTLAPERAERCLLGLDERGRLDQAVEVDGHVLVEVGLGHVVPRRHGLQGVAHRPLADLGVEDGRGRGHRAPLQLRGAEDEAGVLLRPGLGVRGEEHGLFGVVVLGGGVGGEGRVGRDVVGGGARRRVHGQARGGGGVLPARRERRRWAGTSPWPGGRRPVRRTARAGNRAGPWSR